MDCAHIESENDLIHYQPYAGKKNTMAEETYYDEKRDIKRKSLRTLVGKRQIK